VRYALVALALTLLVGGCKLFTSPTPVAPPPTLPPHSTTPPAPTPAIVDGEVLAIFGANGASLCTVVKKGDDYTVKTGDAVLATLKVDVGTLQITDAKGAKAGKVKKDTVNLILDGGDGKRVAKFEAKDGGYRLKDPAGVFLLKMKPKAPDYKIGDANGNELAKLRVKDTKTLIEDPKGKTLYTVTGPLQHPADGLLLTDKLTLMQKVAVMVAAKTL
jgi:hypothetical protein